MCAWGQAALFVPALLPNLAAAHAAGGTSGCSSAPGASDPGDITLACSLPDPYVTVPHQTASHWHWWSAANELLGDCSRHSGCAAADKVSISGLVFWLWGYGMCVCVSLRVCMGVHVFVCTCAHLQWVWVRVWVCMWASGCAMQTEAAGPSKVGRFNCNDADGCREM